jgi:shikimate dehydrogenase
VPKFAAFKHCDQTGPRSIFLQVANVLRREKDGLWLGDHTDGPGFINGMRKAGVDPKDQRALLVGPVAQGLLLRLNFFKKAHRS